MNYLTDSIAYLSIGIGLGMIAFSIMLAFALRDTNDEE